jgi:hypothetical protein
VYPYEALAALVFSPNPTGPINLIREEERTELIVIGPVKL